MYAPAAVYVFVTHEGVFTPAQYGFAAGTAFLLASHLAEATLALADRALVLAGGRWTLDLDRYALTEMAGDARRFEARVLEAMGQRGIAVERVY